MVHACTKRRTNSSATRFVDRWLSPEGKRAYAKHRRLLLVVVGLLATWLVVQYLAARFL